MRLSEKDFGSLSEAILRLYQARDVRALNQELPRILRSLRVRPPHSGGVRPSLARRSASESERERERFLIHSLSMHIAEAYRIAELKGAAREETRGFSSEALRRLFHLSARECEVAHWVAQGKSNPEIGTILNASRRTVEKHMEHILPKLGVENRTSAAAVLMSITKEKRSKWPEERLPRRA